MKKNKPHGFMLSPAIAVCALTLQQVVDNLLPVLAVGTIADMHPIAPFGVVFHDELVKDAFVEDPPVLTNEGGMFREGYNEDLDELRKIGNGKTNHYGMYSQH